jgi:hypothetical protein
LGSIERNSSESKSTENSNQKCLVSVIWPSSGIHGLLALPTEILDDAEFFCAFVLRDIEKNLCDGEPRQTLRGASLHLCNAPAHNSKRSRQEIAWTKITRVVHPTCSPDTAPNDFFSFGSLKGEVASFTANSPADILSEIHRIFQEISKATLVAVYDEWTRFSFSNREKYN